MREIKTEPIKINENWFEDIQKQVDETYQKTIDYGRTQFVNKIVELEQQLEMVKSLYQNEKDHTDTLKRIIKKIEEYINKNNLFCYKYDEEELFEIITDKEAKKYLLDLLKEIK